MKTFGFDQAVQDGHAKFAAAYDAAHIDFGFTREVTIVDHRGSCSRCLTVRNELGRCACTVRAQR